MNAASPFVSRFTTPTVARFIGRCPCCGVTRAVDAPRCEDRPEPADGSWRRVTIAGRTMVVRSRRGAFRVACGCPTEQPGWAVEYKQIRGTKDASVPCDGRCTHARGNSCTCECGGANHGAAHS